MTGVGRYRLLPLALCLAFSAAFAAAQSPAADETGGDGEFAAQRARMVERIEDHARATSSRLLAPQISEPVLAAMGRLPRHEFVPPDIRDLAYLDRPLPIGYGQTISQPFIVALMSDLLVVAPGDKVLEVGTGSAYQAAVLAEMGVEVYTIEIIPQLGERAAQRLDRLGYGEVGTRVGDGYFGWPEQAPFDGIVVTAAAGHVPPPLVEQLKPGGVMVVPVGGRFMVQQLMLVAKDADGMVRTRQLLPVRFVPLTGDH